ncbi:MAG TPA: AmmeMemoRadiSam system protein B [Myxococcaceae bacterium]|nr:AmmeMemoRadiSam system protein B [Myxococcaceae bacterium]
MRPPAVAGSFYPRDAALLRESVDGLLSRAEAPVIGGSLRALIAPHAGYVYSGPIAASAYAVLRRESTPPRCIVLLGPSHFVPFSGLALPESAALATPLGVVPVDPFATSLPQRLGQVVRSERAHRREHSLEVHLPFLQRVLPAGFTVLPLVVGEARPAEVSEVIELLSDRPGTLVLISTDLSHYLRADEAREMDGRTCGIVVAGEVEKLEPEMACGHHPLAGLMLAARRRQWLTELLDVRNSSDTAGDPDRVVGYAAFAVVGRARG